MCLSLSKKILLITLLVCVSQFSLFSHSNPIKDDGGLIPEGFELQVKIRLRAMDCVVVPRLNEDVKLFLSRYIFKHAKYTEKMLGNAALYFPVFDQLLKEKNLPVGLKALSILESWLDLGATSHVGAGGLWQLMPATARMYGLTVNSQVDERRDIYRSTEAALTLLARLHEIYGDWGLALAAYNAGPLRVNRAIKKAGGEVNSFWSIAPYLPRETQQFIPKFIALSYLLNHYADHDIFPEFPDLDLQFIDVIKVHQKLQFSEIAKVTSLDMEVIKALNPAYKERYIPAGKNGFNLVLPARVMPVMEEYLMLTDRSDRNSFISGLEIPPAEESPTFEDIRVNYIESVHYVKEGETLASIAHQYNIDVTRLYLWNHLTHDYLTTGQELLVFMPFEKYMELRKANYADLAELPTIESLDLQKITSLAPYVISLPSKSYLERYEIHVIRPNESLWDICLKYNIPDVKSLMYINGFSDHTSFSPGTPLRVKLLFSIPTLQEKEVALGAGR